MRRDLLDQRGDGLDTRAVPGLREELRAHAEGDEESSEGRLRLLSGRLRGTDRVAYGNQREEVPEGPTRGGEGVLGPRSQRG